MAANVDREAAFRTAQVWLDGLSVELNDEIVLDGDPKETEFGWVFFYNSKRYIETGDVNGALAGNGPIVIMKSTGDVLGTGTAKPLETYLDEIRASLRTP